MLLNDKDLKELEDGCRVVRVTLAHDIMWGKNDLELPIDEKTLTGLALETFQLWTAREIAELFEVFEMEVLK